MGLYTKSTYTRIYMVIHFYIEKIISNNLEYGYKKKKLTFFFFPYY